MKISKIEVKKLFGVFNHVIPMNIDTGITIIIGENGLGKTILLEMVDNLFNSRFQLLRNIVFDELLIEFDDNVKWIVKKGHSTHKMPFLELHQKVGKNTSKYQLTSFDSKEIVAIASEIASNVNFIRRAGPTTWRDMRNGELLRPKDIVTNFDDYWYSNHSNEINFSKMDSDKNFQHNLPLFLETREAAPPKWFCERHEAIKVTLIKTQRLLAIDSPDQKPTNTVEKYSAETLRLIKSKLAESTELSSKLDRTYPNRLIHRLRNVSDISDDALNDQLTILEKKRKLLDEVGLIEIEKDTHFSKIEDEQRVVKDVLMQYVEDSFEKLAIFDDISAKFQLFLYIINKRFKHKKLQIGRESGFTLKSTVLVNDKGEYQTIPVNKLSSGEQNELVLFYELLFKSGPNSLILIDEPEISLHISWQNSFIEDLREINRLNSIDILIATHSPDIISNNWDLKVELKGVE